MQSFDKKGTVAKVAELYEKMQNARMERDERNAGWEIERLGDEMAKLIDQLRDNETDPHQKITYTHAASGLRHTNGKEVGYIDSAYKKTLKSNAAKIRRTEYYNYIDNALRFISVDIGLILIEAREDKQGNASSNPAW